MKNLFSHLRWRFGFSDEQRRMLQRVGDAVDEWIVQKGYTKVLPTLEEIAEDVGVPPDQLSLYIRIRSRKSVLTWRKELRIWEARELLRNFPELPISVIGEMVGIDDKTNFKRQFFQVTGQTPRDWREKHQG